MSEPCCCVARFSESLESSFISYRRGDAGSGSGLQDHNHLSKRQPRRKTHNTYNLLVTHNSSRGTLLSRNARPISASLPYAAAVSMWRYPSRRAAWMVVLTEGVGRENVPRPTAGMGRVWEAKMEAEATGTESGREEGERGSEMVVWGRGIVRGKNGIWIKEVKKGRER